MNVVENNLRNKNMNNKIKLGAVLYVYKGEYGLPSIDFECMRVMCLVKFTNFPVKIATHANPLFSRNGKLPYLQVGHEKFHQYAQIKKFLDEEGYAVDKHLKGEDSALSISYSSWLFNNLHAYYQYFMYCDVDNFETTRALYAKRTPFPFNFYYPGTYVNEAHDVVLRMTGIDSYTKTDKVAEDNLILNAKKCINVLSKKLGKSRWFFGDNYSEFDAIAYSYISLLHETTILKNPLKNHIKGCPNLIKYIDRITRDFFKDEAHCTPMVSKSKATDSSMTPTERELLDSEGKTKILAGLGALVAMVVFTMWRGIYKQMTVTKQGFGYEFDEDDDNVDDE